MRATCIVPSSDVLLGKKSDNTIQYLSKRLLESGITFSRINTIQNAPNEILSEIEDSKDNLVVILGEKSSVKNVNIKKAIANYYDTELVQNNVAINAVQNYYKKQGQPVLLEHENEYYLPENSRVIINSNGPMQGFFIRNNEKSILFLPNDILMVSKMYNYSVLPILLESFSLEYLAYNIKTFGIVEKDILSLLKDLLSNKYKILITTYPQDLEVGIVVRYNKSLSGEIIDKFIQKIYERLNKYIYANEDVSIYKSALDLLKLQNKKIAIAECITGGNVMAGLLACDIEASKYIVDGVVCNTNKSKHDRAKVDNGVLSNYACNSPEMAYEIGAGMLEVTNADLVLVTAGDTEFNPRNKSYSIAVGDNAGIHVYKNTFIGTHEQIIESVSKTSMFYLIKKLKQNDLSFIRDSI